ncbi:hypothetical protein KAR91_76000, partial [Candidatus Pacearchaeota archaeon]|nr:hypothetical protein [Candidatus Pacearchaeota archaeon]
RSAGMWQGWRIPPTFPAKNKADIQNNTKNSPPTPIPAQFHNRNPKKRISKPVKQEISNLS